MRRNEARENDDDSGGQARILQEFVASAGLSRDGLRASREVSLQQSVDGAGNVQDSDDVHLIALFSKSGDAFLSIAVAGIAIRAVSSANDV